MAKAKQLICAIAFSGYVGALLLMPESWVARQTRESFFALQDAVVSAIDPSFADQGD